MKLFRPLIAVCVFLLFISCVKPVESGNEKDLPDVSKDPFQENLSQPQVWNIVNEYGNFMITAVADYVISARVVSSESYSRGWTASLSPVDLALVWGKLADKKMDEFVSYRQSNRWYYYRYSADCPLDNTYIIRHSSNNHIIPATENLKLAIQSVKKDDLLEIEGFLVKVSGTSGGRKMVWGSSTTRTDSGDRSCELIYAELIKINRKIYR